MSERYELVKKYCELGYWTEKMVWNAVGRWINADEFRKITGKEYEKEKE